MKIVNKNAVFRAVGWTALAVGAYFMYLGAEEKVVPTTKETDDSIIDAEFTVVE